MRGAFSTASVSNATSTSVRHVIRSICTPGTTAMLQLLRTPLGRQRRGSSYVFGHKMRVLWVMVGCSPRGEQVCSAHEWGLRQRHSQEKIIDIESKKQRELFVEFRVEHASSKVVLGRPLADDTDGEGDDMTKGREGRKAILERVFQGCMSLPMSSSSRLARIAMHQAREG
ncbi:hypothetical protein MRB53_041143 [Persea americana]|nr:hypothetical protein MRB53_041143 [Persea americana]